MDIVTTPVVTSLSPLAGTPPLPLIPSEAATAQFSALMQVQPSQVAALPTDPTSGPKEVTPQRLTADAPGSVGDRILAGMQGVSAEFQTAWKSVSASLEANAPAMSMQDLLKLQLQLVQVSVQYDMVGKAVSKSTQNFDQLVRMQ